MKKELKLSEKFIMKMDKKLLEQLRKYSFHQNQSLAKTARQALQKFLDEQINN
jgi:hypothetical protein